LSIEFGPIVQVGGKFKSEYDKENNIISGTFVKDIQDISKFNLSSRVTAVKHFRFNICYQYGINNMLENLNSKKLGMILKEIQGY
jgi:hypothetical protein